jgi:type II secretory pathway predicted ATPase ExeA
MNRKLLALFGLKWNPFSPEIPIESLYNTSSIDHFCWRIENMLIREGGYALITGEPGTGKSVTLRILSNRLSQMTDLSVAVLMHPSSNLGNFYRQLGDAFGLDLKPTNRWGGFKSLRDRWVLHQESTLCKPVLLIDEAQEMSASVMNELRLLSSMEFDSKSALTTVLAGDRRLIEKFQTPDLAPLASRMRVRLKMPKATTKQLVSCLTHVMEQAGNKKLIDSHVLVNIAERALGNYRVLCTLANDLLMEAARKELSVIDEKLYLETVGEITETG